MKALRLNEIVSCMNGHLMQGSGNLQITNATTRSYEVRSHTMYFHLPGTNNGEWDSPHFNHAAVITQDPSAVIKLVNKEVALVKVTSVRNAYWEFVRYYRGLFHIPVIGVTGTCGKTTTTEMISHILAKQFKVQSTDTGKNSLSFNLPYLLRLNEKTEAAVFELGVARPGNIQMSGKYFRPQVGVLLNIGVYHLQGCGTLEKYIQAKAEMVQVLPPQGTLILNADDENIKKIDLSRFDGKIISFGISNESHYQAKEVSYVRGGMKFSLQTGKGKYPVFVPGYGEHNVYNALAAIAASHNVGIKVKHACERLSSFRPVSRHLEFRNGRNGCTIIDDTWNCTPPSVDAALNVLKSTAHRRRTVAVLGYMPQLGLSQAAASEYDRIGKKAVESGIDQLILIGEAKRIGTKALQLGMDKQRVVFCETADEVYEALSPLLNKHTLVLLKFPYKYRLRKLPRFPRLMNWLLQTRR